MKSPYRWMSNGLHKNRGLARFHMMMATGVLSAVIVGFGAYALDSTVETNSENEWRTTVDELYLLHEMVDEYHHVHGELPETLATILDDRVPIDPWGNPYRYERRGDAAFTVYSLGSDGEPDTIEDVHLNPSSFD